jgi:amino acid transporter
MSFGSLGPYNVGLNTQNLLAILSILFLTWVNTRGVRTGALVQNILTIAKIASLGGLTLLGFAFATQTASVNFAAFWRNASLSDLHAYPVGQETVMIHTLTLVTCHGRSTIFLPGPTSPSSPAKFETRSETAVGAGVGYRIVTVLYRPM